METAPLLPSAVAPKLRRRQSSLSLSEERSKTWWNGVLAFLLALLLLAVVGGLWASQTAPKIPSDTPDFTKLPGPKPGLRNPNYLVSSLHGAVASEVGICSEIGTQVLREGGTATDAGIAAVLCIGVTNMFSSGIGGGGFLVIRPSTTHANLNSQCTGPISIDFRETAPAASYARMFTARPHEPDFDPKRASRVGGLSVGVPGEIRGLEAAYKTCGGGVPWARLFQPSADLARSSFVGKELARRLNFAPFGGTPFSAWMLKAPVWRDQFVRDGKLLVEGQELKRENYALTLERIGRDGPDVFYEGKIAQSLVATIAAAGGNLTLADLKNYSAIIQPALQSTYRNRPYYTAQAPSGGPLVVSLLNTIETYEDFVDDGRTGLAIHRFVEALKFAFAARTELGDPKFIHNSKKLRELTTKKFAAQVRANITDDTTHNLSYYNPHYENKDDHGTTHVSVIAEDGSAIAITSTVNLLFGSQVMDESTGIILNDEMDDFATPGIPDAFGLNPSPFNFPAPGKRPLSSTAPLIMDGIDGEVYLSIGGSGGSRIFGSVAQVITNLDWGYDVANAVEQPRVHDQLSPAYVSIESGYQPELIDALLSRGHNVTLFDVNLAIAEVQAVVRHANGRFFASSDSRKNGRAAAV